MPILLAGTIEFVHIEQISALFKFRLIQVSLYKTILKPIWTYGIQLWGTASTSNIEILDSFQSKTLLVIVDALSNCNSKLVCLWKGEFSS
jgi:hypothetical protein